MRAYPQNDKDPLQENRTNQGTLDRAISMRKNKHLKHVSGGLAYFWILFYNITTGMVPDCMHCALLGVNDHFIKFRLKDVGAPYYISSASLIDYIFLTIKPPSEIRRTPWWKLDLLKSFADPVSFSSV